MTIPKVGEQSPIIFLGGVFLPSQRDAILERSHGVVQNAADALQKAFLRGFAVNVGDNIELVNLPFVGSYPRMYETMTFPACEDTLPPGIKASGEGFLNLRFIRFWSRFVSAFRGLRRATKDSERPVVVVYSAHLPFLFAARLIRFFRRDVVLCVIVPDLPEFMGVGGWLYSTYKNVETVIFRRIVRGFDSFVFLTDAMGDRIGIPSEKCIVVEGIYDQLHDSIEQEPEIIDDDGFVILYTGTLATRYGVLDLLHAFEQVDIAEAKLWICGEGDARDVIEKMAASEPRIRYFGQVPRAKALALQRVANVLVNPRRPESEFTKYSFPSKTMEYLASGKQVVMHAMPGIPPEYLEHLIIPETPDCAGLVKALRVVQSLSPKEREDRGTKAQEFILSKKSPDAQVARVLEHLEQLR